ncbi:hypothetical protein [Halomonas sp.]
MFNISEDATLAYRRSCRKMLKDMNRLRAELAEIPEEAELFRQLAEQQ